MTNDVWFRDAAVRGRPFAPADLDVFELPHEELEDWAQRVSTDPRAVRCSLVEIRSLSRVTRTLADVIKQDHGLDTTGVVALLDEYLGAACPRCFAGLAGNMLQLVASAAQAAAVAGGGDELQRLLNGRCAYCESTEYLVIWHGDTGEQAGGVGL